MPQALAEERLSLLGKGLRDEAAAMEAVLAELLVQSCQFDLQSGYTELGISKIQAALEFTLLTPRWTNSVPGAGEPCSLCPTLHICRAYLLMPA